MKEMKYDIKKDSAIYSMIYTPRLAGWIINGKIKKGETEVWRSGLSGWRRPEDLPELKPYFELYEREKSKKKRAKFPILKKKIENILIIDDEEDLNWLLADGLACNGFNVITAKDGKEGVAVFKEKHPDLVLLDEKLPDSSGIEILTKIKQIDPQVVVFMISAYGSDELKKDARKGGVYYFIDKPFGVERITKAIKNYLNKT